MIENYDELSELDREIYTNELAKCNKCKSFKDCKQSVKGYMPIIIYDEIFNKYRIGSRKCSKMQGATNTPLIRNIEYQTFEAHNKQDLLNHLNEHRTLYIYGPPGIGKTHFLYYTANSYNKVGQNVYINLVQNCMREIKEALGKYNFNDRESNTKSLIKTLQTIDVLCLDDLGNERPSSFTLLEVLQAVIDYRYLHKKTTIISSNHKPDELFGLYKNTKDVEPTQIAPIISKLKDFGVIKFNGKYWRRK